MNDSENFPESWRKGFHILLSGWYSEKIKLLSCEKVSLPDKNIFTSLGRLDYNKNQILLLKAAKEVKKTRSDFLIYLLGDGEDNQKVEKYICDNELDLDEAVGFLYSVLGIPEQAS